jgi:hypothetical protein
MEDLRDQFLPQVQATAKAIEADTRSSVAAV